MIRVVEVIPTLNMGGAESMVRDYCLLIDKKQFDVCVIVLTEHKGSPIEKNLEDNGIHVVYLGEQLYESQDINKLKKAIRRVHRYYAFRSIILSLSPDVIHIHLQIGKYMRVLPLRKLDVSLFLTVHNVTWRFFSEDVKDGIRYREYKEVYRLVHSYGLKLIALRDDLNAKLRELFDTDGVITIKNGIQLDRFNPHLYDRVIERKRIGIKSDELVLGHVGSMHPQKNHDLILEIFYAFHEKQPNSILLLIGKGELMTHIIDRISEMHLKDSVIILSNRNDVPQLMSAMDVFLFPSKWEGFGNALVEAQCMGLPCVVSDVVPEETRITDMVRVVTLDSSINEWTDAVFDAISGTIGSKATCKKTDYDIKECVKALENLYKSAI